MTDAPRDRIRQSRERLLNPYAYLSEDGGYEATLPLVEAVGPRQSDPSQDLIRQDRERLQNQYAHVSDDGYEAILPFPDSDGPHLSTPRIDAKALLGGKNRGDRFSRHEIDDIARRLHVALWGQRDPLASVNPLEVVDPVMALESLGFNVSFDDASLGDVEADGEILGAAGVLDRDNSLVRMSPRFSGVQQRFTLAHELGHVLMHAGSGLHRDRAVDGSSSQRSLPPYEREANQFAAAFLMPAKLVREEFTRRFRTDDFVLDTAARFGLGDAYADLARKRHPTRSDLARLLARVTHFHGVPFASLAAYFQVSEGAMAIRLEELKLVGS
jgi:Zn-dependent peptidase ImmA (M78 family)